MSEGITMVWIVWGIFSEKWLARAERGERACVDDGDRFISLWIAFNGWMRGKYGETHSDRFLLEKVKNSDDLSNVFLAMKDTDIRDSLLQLREYTVMNMRYPEDPSKVLLYDGAFAALVEVLYSVRCNLFHGRKNISDDNEDIRLVSLAYRILLPLFKRYLTQHIA